MGSVPSRGGPRKRRCPGSPAPRRKRRSAPDGTKPNGPSSPGWCALRLRSPLAKPSSCGSSGTPGWRPGPVTAASAGIAWSATRWPRSPRDGGVAVFFGGGKLARDLSLPVLRERWRYGEPRAGPKARQATTAAWRCAAGQRWTWVPRAGGPGRAVASTTQRGEPCDAPSRGRDQLAKCRPGAVCRPGSPSRHDPKGRTPPRPPRQSPGHGRGSSAAWLFDAQSLHVGV